MLTVRCTGKLLNRLRVPPEASPADSTTCLGDWYATILPVRPVHLILLVNESTRLAALLPAREISTLARRIPGAISEVLRKLGASAKVIDTECAAMSEVVYARTASRSVLGTMNDYIVMMEAGSMNGSEASLLDLAMFLNRTPVSPLDYARPNDVARRALGLAEGPIESSESTAQSSAGPPVFVLRVSLRDVEPEIWRTMRVRANLTLFKFHSILQTVMGWTDIHMHQFRVGERVFGRPDPEFPGCLSEKKAFLADVLHAVGDQFVYEYDFGDGWEHEVVLDQVLDADPAGKFPHVTDGRRACPPDDCGGPPGYEHLLEVLSKPRHPEHRDLVDWVGGSFDPEAFDIGAINCAFHGRWHLPARPDAPRSETALPRELRPRLVAKPRHR